MSKKKRKLLSKKEKLLIIVISIIAFLVILAIALTINKPTELAKNQVDMNDLYRNLNTVEEVVVYLESKFISMEKSKQAGFDTDIYVEFKYNLYEGNESKQIYFENFYERIAEVTGFKNFRIIDTAKGITIEVKCEPARISEVNINGEIDYFKKEESRRSKKQALDVNNIELEVNSPELESLISANWNTSKATSLGSKESSYRKYDIYFDEGYEIRTIRGKVYNIVFNKKYAGKVVGGYKPGDSLEKIEANLGTSYNDSGVLGYKTKDFYVYYSTDEISVYPNNQYDYTEFETLVKKYDSKNDMNEFANLLTDIWPDYDYYDYDDYYFEIDYTLKGVKVQYSQNNPEGIQIYENYKGEFKETQEDYRDLYYKLNQNLIIEKEQSRLMAKAFFNNSQSETEPLHYSSRFYFESSADGEYYKDVAIKSLDENYPNNEFQSTIRIKSYVWADDSHLVYSISGEGIFIYDAENRTTEKLLAGEDAYEITNYDRSSDIIEYDGKQAKINF